MAESLDGFHLADQENINEFSRLSIRKRELEKQADGVSQAIQHGHEALEELDLVLDEEQPVPIKTGDCFAQLNIDMARRTIGQMLQKYKQQLESLHTNMEETVSGMTGLKSTLYAKFGSSIRLEE